VTDVNLGSSFLLHQQALKAFLLRHLRCPETAADLLHDCFIRLAQQPHSGAIGNVRAFLFACARNLLVDHLRKQQHRQHEPLPANEAGEPHGAPLENVVIDREHLERLQQAIERLPPRCREVFLLSRLHGLTYADIGERLGISSKTAFAHMVRALQRLNAELHDFDC